MLSIRLHAAWLLMCVCYSWPPPADGQQLTCNGSFTEERYAGGGRFITAIKAKSYDCSCRGRACEQIVCIVLNRNDANSTAAGDRETCRDPKTGRRYARGTTFVRHGKNGRNLACTCAVEGRLKIECKKPTCKVPPPPPPTRRRSQVVADSCYDQHNDNWHRQGTPYIRRVVMSYSPDIIGEYQCTCNGVATACRAIDIPCCDITTGTFVTKNQRFNTLIGGTESNCLCLGGRGRAGQCENLSDRRHISGSRIVRRRRCFDSKTKRYYHEGARFVRIRKSNELLCKCGRVNRKKLKITCRPRARDGDIF